MTQPTRPVWLLDIDGVVNALARGPVAGSWPADQWVQHVVPADIPGSGRMVLPIFVARPVLDFVARVVETGAAEVIWHSTWREAAVSDLAPVLGLPAHADLARAGMDAASRAHLVEAPGGARVIESGRRLVWTDDDIAVVPEQVGDLAARPDTLLISPDPYTGLTPADLAAIADFIGMDGIPGDVRDSTPRRSLLGRLLRS